MVSWSSATVEGWFRPRDGTGRDRAHIMCRRAAGPRQEEGHCPLPGLDRAPGATGFAVGGTRSLLEADGELARVLMVK